MITCALRCRLVSACSLTALAVMCPAAAFAAEAAADQPGATIPEEEILVIGERYISGIQPERELDQQAIESYGQSTIDELIAEVQGELDDDETPLILVNGERVNSLEDIGGLPVEALRNVKVLPRGSAVPAGGNSTQRVLSLQLNRKMRSATALVADKLSTDGDWSGKRGEAILTYIEGARRVNVTFKVRDEDSLFESDRGIVQPEASPPFANDPAITDLGRFRTLRPDSRNYDLNGTFATRLAPWLTGMAGLRLNQSSRLSERGLPTALFLLPASHPSSPFPTDVELSFHGLEPLHTRSRHRGGDGNITLNGTFGRWTSHFNARHSQARDETFTQRKAASGTIPIEDNVDPFGDDLFDLVTIRTDKATSRTTVTSALWNFTGPALKLPAGDLQATVEGQFFDNRLRSTSTFSGVEQKRSYHRSQWSLRGAIEAPLVSARPIVGEVSATAQATVEDFSDAGTLQDYALGLTWEPFPALRFRGEFEKTQLPASIQTLANPVIVTSGVRAFDPLTGETVDVTQITGGNPDLSPEETTTWRFGEQWTLVERLHLQFSAEYIDTEERNFVSSIPDASAAVMLAFPDRFIRDLSGTLTTIDLRAVNFDRHRERRLRYGLSLNTNLTKGGLTVRSATAADSANEADAPARSGRPAVRNRPLRLQLSANHSVVLQDEITIRPGLGSVDLLEGGAIGIGGGRVRHQLDGTAALSSGGVGLRLGVNWRGKYTLESRVGTITDTLRFSPVLLVNLRAFADLSRFLPEQNWAKGMRLSLNAQNLTNDRQEVHDSAGNTPLQYQPGYRDPLGRTIELELRKIF